MVLIRSVQSKESINIEGFQIFQPTNKYCMAFNNFFSSLQGTFNIMNQYKKFNDSIIKEAESIPGGVSENPRGCLPLRLSSVNTCTTSEEILPHNVFFYYHKEQEDEEAIYADNYRLIKGTFSLIRS